MSVALSFENAVPHLISSLSLIPWIIMIHIDPTLDTPLPLPHWIFRFHIDKVPRTRPHVPGEDVGQRLVMCTEEEQFGQVSLRLLRSGVQLSVGSRLIVQFGSRSWLDGSRWVI